MDVVAPKYSKENNVDGLASRHIKSRQAGATAQFVLLPALGTNEAVISGCAMG